MPPIRLEQIWIAPTAKAPPCSVAAAEIEAHCGIVGDRYHTGIGSFSRFATRGRPITLISYEALIRIHKHLALDLLSAGLHRRNLVISGCNAEDFGELMSRTFRIGGVVFSGQGTAHPCRFLEKVAPPGSFDALRHCGGMRADVSEGGRIQCGDIVQPEGPLRTLP